MVLDEARLEARVRKVLDPFADDFSGSLGRGDLVIPKSEVDRVVTTILEAAREAARNEDDVSAQDFFEALSETRRLSSVQEQADRLRARFRIHRR